MKATKIDWCDATVNPVVGCLHNCPYCYARKMNERFHWVTDFNGPQYFPERLKALYAKSPKTIFMDSMSDIAFWHLADKNAAADTLRAIVKNPQHRYIFLTKSASGINLLPRLTTAAGNQTIFNGYSVDTQSRLDGYFDKFDFLSIEPILEPIRLPFPEMPTLKQIIIGAETGNRKGKVIPPKTWIKSLTAQARVRGLRVFMKESLREIMGNDFEQDPLIWDTIERRTAARNKKEDI